MSDIRELILQAREKRWSEIHFLKTSFKSVITVKTNFPGDAKQVNVAYVLVRLFKELIPFDMVAYSRMYDGYDGPYFLLGSDYEPETVKSVLARLEDTHPLGRLIDLDVFNGKMMLTRGHMRKCYLCDKEAFVCIREGNHTLEELIYFFENSVLDYYVNTTQHLVDECILTELNLHPKFGLVTPYTPGSHQDMDFSIMIKAKEAILPFFSFMFQRGWSSDKLEDIFRDIRIIGLNAEQAMIKATNNVNAYKGLIFNMGIMITAYAYVLYNNIVIDSIFDIARKLSLTVLGDFQNDQESNGMQMYKQYGITGARGEAYAGFPSVKKALRHLVDMSQNSKLKTLAYLISIVEDTVLMKRTKSMEEYENIKDRFRNLLRNHMKNVEELNGFCIEKNYSFGGSADLFILTVFLKKIGL